MLTSYKKEPWSKEPNGDRDEKEPEAGLWVVLSPAQKAHSCERKPVDHAEGQNNNGEHEGNAPRGQMKAAHSSIAVALNFAFGEKRRELILLSFNEHKHLKKYSFKLK